MGIVAMMMMSHSDDRQWQAAPVCLKNSVAAAAGTVPRQLELSPLLADVAARGYATSYIRTAGRKLAHFENELAVHDRSLEKWRAELLRLDQKKPEAKNRIAELRTIIREGESRRRKVCRLMDDLHAILRPSRQVAPV